MLRPDILLALHRQGRLRSSFRLMGHPCQTSIITMRQTTNYRSRTFTGKIHGPMGCEPSAQREGFKKDAAWILSLKNNTSAIFAVSAVNISPPSAPSAQREGFKKDAAWFLLIGRDGHRGKNQNKQCHHIYDMNSHGAPSRACMTITADI